MISPSISNCLEGFRPISVKRRLDFAITIMLLSNISLLHFMRPLRHAPNFGQSVRFVLCRVLSLHSFFIAFLHYGFSSHISSNLKCLLFRCSSCSVVRIIRELCDPTSTSFIHCKVENRCAQVEFTRIRYKLSYTRFSPLLLFHHVNRYPFDTKSSIPISFLT